MIAREDVEDLIHREARLLDLGRWDEWIGLYTDDCEYWVPAEVGQTDRTLRISVFLEDRVLMEARIGRLKHPAAHSLITPVRTSHVVSGITVEPGETDKDIVSTSSFHMLEQHGENQRHFGGIYTHRVRRDDGDLKIQSKRVDITNCDAALEVIEVFI